MGPRVRPLRRKLLPSLCFLVTFVRSEQSGYERRLCDREIGVWTRVTFNMLVGRRFPIPSREETTSRLPRPPFSVRLLGGEPVRDVRTHGDPRSMSDVTPYFLGPCTPDPSTSDHGTP